MKYWFIKSNEKVFPIDKMCKVLEVSFSSYYRWKRSSVSNKVTKKEHLKVVINDTYFQYKQRYGVQGFVLTYRREVLKYHELQ